MRSISKHMQHVVTIKQSSRIHQVIVKIYSTKKGPPHTPNNRSSTGEPIVFEENVRSERGRLLCSSSDPSLPLFKNSRPSVRSLDTLDQCETLGKSPR